MLTVDQYRDLRNDERFKTNTDHKMSENGSIEDDRVGNLSKNTEEEIPEVRVPTQEVVNEQIKGFIAPSHVS